MSAASQPVADSARSNSENRRRGRRHRLDIPAALVAEGLSVPTAEIAVRITELSVGGVGLRSQQPLEVGRIYDVRAFDTLVPTGMRIKIISHRCAPEGSGFEIGAESL